MASGKKFAQSLIGSVALTACVSTAFAFPDRLISPAIVDSQGSAFRHTGSSSSRLDEIQDEWQDIIYSNQGQNLEKLALRLKNSALFDQSCFNPKHEKDFNEMLNGLMTLMLSRPRRQSDSNDNDRGRFLACLDQSGLATVASEIERNFLLGFRGTTRTLPAIECKWRPGHAGISNPAVMDTYYGLVSIFMTAADEGKGKTQDGSPTTYANVLLHEFIHVGGIRNETITHAATACCGDASDDRVAACKKLDALLAKKTRAEELEKYLGGTTVGGVRLRDSINKKFLDSGLDYTASSMATQDLYPSFFSGLDEYNLGSPPQGKFSIGLLRREEFLNCLAKKNRYNCRSQWRNHIKSYVDDFFSRQCPLKLPGSLLEKCKLFSEPYKKELAENISKRLSNPD